MLSARKSRSPGPQRTLRSASAVAFLFALALGCGSSRAAEIQAEQVGLTIDAGNRSEPVTPYEYGMFIEPIGGLIARTMWAEMLDDRKFYYPIVPEGKDPPPPRSVEGRRCRPRRAHQVLSAHQFDCVDPAREADSHALPGRHKAPIQMGEHWDRGVGSVSDLAGGQAGTEREPAGKRRSAS